MKRQSMPLTLSQLCESALNELENNALETAQTDVREFEAEKARIELYARLKEQLAGFSPQTEVCEATAEQDQGLKAST